MNATLTLDNDVARLLERARKERGGSLEKLGNTLLRRELELMKTVGFELLSRDKSEPAALPDSAPLEEHIDQLYDEIRDLIARSKEKPELKAEIERKREQLHQFQAEEAAVWRQRADARRSLKPGEGYRLLERAESLLDS